MCSRLWADSLPLAFFDILDAVAIGGFANDVLTEDGSLRGAAPSHATLPLRHRFSTGLYRQFSTLPSHSECYEISPDTYFK